MPHTLVTIRKRRSGVFVTEPMSAALSADALNAAEAVSADDRAHTVTIVRGPGRTYWVELRNPSEVLGTEVSLPMAEQVAALLLGEEPFRAVREYLDRLAVEWRSSQRSILDDDPESIRQGRHPAFFRK